MPTNPEHTPPCVCADCGHAPPCVCADCGHEQPTMDPCAKCRSVRVVLVSVIRNLFGDNWRDTCFPTFPTEKTP